MRDLAFLTFCLSTLLSGAPPEPGFEARTVPVATIPHITAGGGWRTTVRVANPTRIEQEVRLETYRPNGDVMTSTVNARAAASHTHSVAPQGVLDLVLSGQAENEHGYAFLMFLGGSALPHTVLYEAHGELQGSTGKVAGGQYLSEFFQFDNTGEGSTGLAFLLPASTADALHRLTCYASNGAILGTFSFPVSGTRPLPPGGFRKFLLSTPGNLGATEDLKGLCYFSLDNPSTAADKAMSRHVVSLRFMKHGFLPLTF